MNRISTWTRRRTNGNTLWHPCICRRVNTSTIMKPNEYFLMALMPISNFACWYQLIKSGGDYSWQLPCFTFYWLWAVKNRVFGPLKQDAGVVTFLPGILSGLLRHTVFANQTLAPCSSVVTCARTGLETASNLLIALNFLFLVSEFVKSKTFPWNATNSKGKFKGKNDLFVKVTMVLFFVRAHKIFLWICQTVLQV